MKEFNITVKATAYVSIPVVAETDEEACEICMDRLVNECDIDWNDEVSFSVESIHNPDGTTTYF